MTAEVSDRQRIAGLLRRAGVAASGVPLEALSGTGNRTFAAGEVVVRLPGRETTALVDRGAEAFNAAAAARLGVAPEVLLQEDDGAMVLRRVPGRPLAALPVAERTPALRRLGSTLARLHGGPPFRGLMDPWAKIRLYLGEAGLDDPGEDAAFGPLWPRIAALAPVLAFGRLPLAPCHVDPVLDNALDDGDRVVLVDWEYAAMSDPLWDLAYVAVEGGLDGDETAALLAAYGGAVDGLRLSAWLVMARAVSSAWCMARAAAGDAPFWRAEVANRLAGLAAALDHRDRHRGRTS